MNLIWLLWRIWVWILLWVLPGLCCRVSVGSFLPNTCTQINQRLCPDVCEWEGMVVYLCVTDRWAAPRLSRSDSWDWLQHLRHLYEDERLDQSWISSVRLVQFACSWAVSAGIRVSRKMGWRSFKSCWMSTGNGKWQIYPHNKSILDAAFYLPA